MTTTARFFVTDGPLATTITQATQSYFREALASNTGGIRVARRDGSTDLIAGSRYLDAGTAIRGEVLDDVLQIIYLGVAITEYDDWTTYAAITSSDYPLGA